jgi:hypothetical protein
MNVPQGESVDGVTEQLGVFADSAPASSEVIDAITWTAMRVILESALGDVWASGAGADMGRCSVGGVTYRSVRLTGWAMEIVSEACIPDSWLDRVWPARAGEQLGSDLLEEWGSAWRAEVSVACDLALADRGEVLEALCEKALLHSGSYADMVVMIDLRADATSLLERDFPTWDVFNLV